MAPALPAEHWAGPSAFWLLFGAMPKSDKRKNPLCNEWSNRRKVIKTEPKEKVEQRKVIKTEPKDRSSIAMYFYLTQFA